MFPNDPKQNVWADLRKHTFVTENRIDTNLFLSIPFNVFLSRNFGEVSNCTLNQKF